MKHDVFAMRAIRQRLPIQLTLALCLLASCGCGSNGFSFSSGGGRNTTMTLISNQENTAFRIRPVNGTWRDAGTGKILEVSVAAATAYEVSATPPGYKAKVITVRRPVSELRFTFEISDKHDAGHRVVEVDVRALLVANAEVAVTASGKSANWSRVRECVGKCAEKLARSPKLRGRRVAVLPLREGPNSLGLGGEAQAMLISELRARTRDIIVVERDQLVKVMEEHDLRELDIVKDPKRLGKILPVDYVIVGSVARLQD